MQLLMLMCVAAAALAEEPISTPNYHQHVGIPMAARVWRTEQALDFDGSRIAGGSPAALGQHPYTVGVVITLADGRTSVCGASMLNNVRALSAAHCWWDGFNQALSYELVFGSLRLFTGGTRVTTNQVEVHASYNPFNANHDLAMVTFEWVDYTARVGRVAPSTGTATLAGLWATAVGFGKLRDADPINNYQIQSRATVQVLTNANCQVYFGPWVVLASTLCTSGVGGVGLCGGDMGGPLVIGADNARQLVGVGSFASSRGCQLGLPSGFTRVTSYTAWITARLGP